MNFGRTDYDRMNILSMLYSCKAWGVIFFDAHGAIKEYYKIPGKTLYRKKVIGFLEGKGGVLKSFKIKNDKP